MVLIRNTLINIVKITYTCTRLNPQNWFTFKNAQAANDIAMVTSYP
jgi:hypothetical protein